MAALRGVHGAETIDQELSLYYVANDIAETYRGMTKMINEAVPRIAAQHRQAAERLKLLNQKTAKLQQTTRKALKGDTRSLEELNAAIKQQERANARSAAQLRRAQAHLRKVLAE